MHKVLPGQLELPFTEPEYRQCDGGCVYVSAEGRLYGYCLKCGVPYVYTHDGTLKRPDHEK